MKMLLLILGLVAIHIVYYYLNKVRKQVPPTLQAKVLVTILVVVALGYAAYYLNVPSITP